MSSRLSQNGVPSLLNQQESPCVTFEKKTKELDISDESIKKKSFYNVISVLYLCRKFIKTLLNLTALRKIKWLNSHQFELINDKCYFQQKKGDAFLGRSFTCWKFGIFKFLKRNRITKYNYLIEVGNKIIK